MNVAKQITNGAQPLGAVVASKDIYDTFMAAGGPRRTCWSLPTATPTRRHPVACAGGHGRAGHAGARKHARAGAGAAPRFRERRARPQGRQARHRHPQLRPGRRHHASLPCPGEPAKRPYEIAMAHAWKKASMCATAATPSSWRHPSSARRPRSTAWSTHWAKPSRQSA